MCSAHNNTQTMLLTTNCRWCCPRSCITFCQCLRLQLKTLLEALTFNLDLCDARDAHVTGQVSGTLKELVISLLNCVFAAEGCGRSYIFGINVQCNIRVQVGGEM